MNERIREFADQCEGRTICECGEVGFNFEKFAELLVRECADYVQFYYKDHACEVIAHDMKTHFGVKE